MTGEEVNDENYRLSLGTRGGGAAPMKQGDLPCPSCKHPADNHPPERRNRYRRQCSAFVGASRCGCGITYEEIVAHHRENPSITCPKCSMTSYNATDVKLEYCGKCELYHADMQLAPIRRWASLERINRAKDDLKIADAEFGLLLAQPDRPSAIAEELVVRCELARLALSSPVPLPLLEELRAKLRSQVSG